MTGWIGVDLDGTLAHYDKWEGVDKIGAPVPAMVERVRGWLEEKKDVRIMTSRVNEKNKEMRDKVLELIQAWCLTHVGAVLEITCAKDKLMIELWDDRVVQVVKNTGEPIADKLRRELEALIPKKSVVLKHKWTRFNGLPICSVCGAVQKADRQDPSCTGFPAGVQRIST